MGDAGQDQEQGQFGQAGLAESGGEAELIGELFEGGKEAEDGAVGGVGGGEVVEIAAEQTAEGLDAGARPMGEVGEGTLEDFGAPAEAFEGVSSSYKLAGWGKSVGEYWWSGSRPLPVSR
jgi:hypothetical protein